VQAQDRLWQMDMSRRGVSGRLSEILGEGLLDTDRFTLTIGFRRAAEESLAVLNAETRRLLEAYARGVNHYIESLLYQPRVGSAVPGSGDLAGAGRPG